MLILAMFGVAVSAIATMRSDTTATVWGWCAITGIFLIIGALSVAQS